MKRFAFLALPALALACMLSLPETSFAQRRVGVSIGYGGGYGGYGGGYRNYGYGGYGGGYRNYGYPYGGYRGGGWNYNPGWSVNIGLGGSPYYGGYGRGYYSPYAVGGYGYSAPAYVTPYVYTPPVYVTGPATSSYQSLYSDAAPPAYDPTRAAIHVRVPADAQVFFDDTPTSQTGTDRMFVTAGLEKGSNYAYTITARWMENGKERRQNRTVNLILGQTVDVDFTSPAPLPLPAQVR